VPNPSDTIRNFCIAVRYAKSSSRRAGAEATWVEGSGSCGQARTRQERAGEMLAIMVVRQLPPSESLSSRRQAGAEAT
jgi:hypothetical protein